jgi:hypothetical protein
VLGALLYKGTMDVVVSKEWCFSQRATVGNERVLSKTQRERMTVIDSKVRGCGNERMRDNACWRGQRGKETKRFILYLPMTNAAIGRLDYVIPTPHGCAGSRR